MNFLISLSKIYSNQHSQISNLGFGLDTGSFWIWYKCVYGNRYYCIDLQCMYITVWKFHVFQSGRIKQYIKIGNGISVKLQLLLFCWQKHVFTFNFCFGLHTMKINTRLHALINLYKSYVIYKGRLLLYQQTCLFAIFDISSCFSRYFLEIIQVSWFLK